MSDRTVFSFSLAIAGIFMAAGLSGCGFKSDLTIPDQESDSPLFQPDNQPKIETAEIPPYLPSSAEAPGGVEGVEVEIATEVATDGAILISPAEETETETETANGVPVDLTDVLESSNSDQ